MNKPMTAREFVVHNNQCPRCRSEEVEWGDINVEGQSTFQDATCLECGARFYTVSRLVGYGWLDRDGDDVQAIAEDFGEITSEEEPSVKLCGPAAELLAAAEQLIHDWDKRNLSHAVQRLGRVAEQVKARMAESVDAGRKADPC